MKKRIPSWDEFSNHERSQTDCPMQILTRGTIGSTTKTEKFTKKLMNQIYRDYIRLVLILGKQSYRENPPPYRDNKIDKSLPILNFTSHNHNALVDASKIFNKIDDYAIAADKTVLAKEFKDSDFIPKTVFDIKNIKDLQLPIIAKPCNGHSAIGIEKFESYDDAQNSKLEFDLWSECKDIDREFRAFVIDDEIVHITERLTNSNNDASVGVKDPDEKIDLVYIDQEMDSFPYMEDIIEIKNELQKKVNLDFYCIDLILDKDEKMWVPEINGAPGIGPSTFCAVYPSFVKMAYSKELSDDVINDLNKIKDEYDKNMRKTYPTEYKNSLAPKK